jgi:Recombinase
MHESTERKRRLRQKRRDANIQAYEVWLPKSLVDEVKRPEESINALVSRALNLLRRRTLEEPRHETSLVTSPRPHDYKGTPYTIIREKSEEQGTARGARLIWKNEDLKAMDATSSETSPETSPIPTTASTSYEQHKVALVQRIRAMRAEGLSYQDIASRLNAEGVETLSHRGSWKKGTVGNLLGETS